jgi:ParB family chromosome partitioning protein
VTLSTIPLHRLVHSRSNARRTGRTIALGELVSSISSHGLRQNLNVRPITGGRFEVVAGGRRLLALKQLAGSGTLPVDHPIPCLLLNPDDNPTEVSLAENAVREAMHPDDQCTAFEGLVKAGSSVEDVAARFGFTSAVVRQRLKLAAVAPSLRALFRKGQLTLDQMMAFALVDDYAAQELAWAELPAWNKGARSHPKGADPVDHSGYASPGPLRRPRDLHRVRWSRDPRPFRRSGRVLPG